MSMFVGKKKNLISKGKILKNLYNMVWGGRFK